MPGYDLRKAKVFRKGTTTRESPIEPFEEPQTPSMEEPHTPSMEEPLTPSFEEPLRPPLEERSRPSDEEPQTASFEEQTPTFEVEYDQPEFDMVK